jgi:hypothetical protein
MSANILYHQPILLSLQNAPDYGPLPFRYNPLWSQNEKVLELVKQVWKTWIIGSPNFIWEQKLKLVKSAIKDWAKIHYISPTKEKEQIHTNLDILQFGMDKVEITKKLLEEESKLQNQLNKAIKVEEEFWRIKSRSLWLKVGD